MRTVRVGGPAARTGGGREDARQRVTDGGWRPRCRTTGLAAHGRVRSDVILVKCIVDPQTCADVLSWSTNSQSVSLRSLVIIQVSLEVHTCVK